MTPKRQETIAIMSRLRSASDGFASIHGKDAPNIYAEALKEIEHLSAIEARVALMISGPGYHVSCAIQSGQGYTFSDAGRELHERHKAGMELLKLVQKGRGS